MKMGYMIAGVTPEVTIIFQESSYAALDLKLHLIQGSARLEMVRPTSIAPGQFQQTVRIGSSIGPNSGSGTLGLYGKTTSSVGAVEILGLTNYNVIRTEDLTKGKFYCTFQASLYLYLTISKTMMKMSS